MASSLHFPVPMSDTNFQGRPSSTDCWVRVCRLPWNRGGVGEWQLWQLGLSEFFRETLKIQWFMTIFPFKRTILGHSPIFRHIPYFSSIVVLHSRNKVGNVSEHELFLDIQRSNKHVDGSMVRTLDVLIGAISSSTGNSHFFLVPLREPASKSWSQGM